MRSFLKRADFGMQGEKFQNRERSSEGRLGLQKDGGDRSAFRKKVLNLEF